MKEQKKFLIPSLWIATGVSAFGILFARAVYAELLWLTITASVLLFGSLSALIVLNRSSFRGRAAAYGFNSLITVLLVIGLIGVGNFVATRYPAKWDTTKNQLHTLSEDSVKLIKGLKKPVKAVYYGKGNQNDQVRPLLENLKGLNPEFSVEFVDPDKEPSRARQAGVKQYGTLQLIVGEKENNIEEATEEKITNALIKLIKDKAQTLCAITGHGERSFTSAAADGYQVAQDELKKQYYEVKEINLMQEGKIPETCSAIAIIGPTKAFFEAEVKTISEYLASGGNALLALDIDVKGAKLAPELNPVLAQWHVRPSDSLIVDPVSRMLGVDAAVPVLASFSKDSPITRDFQGNCYFPFSRPLEVIGGQPAGLKVTWLAQTTPKSWGESNLRELATGQVQMNQGSDAPGPLTTAVAIEGKLPAKQADEKVKSTRMVVFGTSLFASNNYSRFGANMDFFMNSMNWLMEEDNLISIRAKEEEAGRVELSEKQGSFIFILTVLILPLLISAGGITTWALRRRL